MKPGTRVRISEKRLEDPGGLKLRNETGTVVGEGWFDNSLVVRLDRKGMETPRIYHGGDPTFLEDGWHLCKSFLIPIEDKREPQKLRNHCNLL